MKKFSKIILVVAAVCFALGLSITAVAALAGGARDVQRKISGITGRNGRYDYPDDLDDIFDRYDRDDDDWDDVYDDDWDDAYDDDWDDIYDDDWDDIYDDDWVRRNESRQAGQSQGRGQSQTQAQSQPQTQTQAQSQTQPQTQTQAQSQSRNQLESQPQIAASSGDKIYTPTGQLDIEISTGRLEVREGEADDDIRIQVLSDDILLRSELEGSERKLEFVPAKAGSIRAADDVGVIVTIPKDYEFDKLSLDAGAGVITADRVLARQLELGADAGEIKVEEGSVRILDADCGTGKIEYKGTASSGVKAECEMGDIRLRLTGKKEDFNYNLETEMGSIEIQGETYDGRKRQTLPHAGAAGTVSLECQLGKISLDFDGE